MRVDYALAEMFHSLRSQFSTLESGRGKHSKYSTSVFTEHGVAILSSVLDVSKRVENVSEIYLDIPNWPTSCWPIRSNSILATTCSSR